MTPGLFILFISIKILVNHFIKVELVFVLELEKKKYPCLMFLTCVEKLVCYL